MVDAREYHERTKHSPEGVRRDDFTLDHANRPRPYKVYEELPRADFRGDPAPPEAPALSAIATASADPTAAADPGALDAGDLHALCHYAAGVTKELEIHGQPTRFRAAACTGKLYHVDLYAVAGDLAGLDAGVYHFDPDSGSLDVLRQGDFRGVLASAAGDGGAVADAPVTVVAASEWWRNAWKYRTRTYRHAFWDSGTILANLLAVAHAGGRRASVVGAFADYPVARLLGLDPESEAPLALVPVGRGDPAPDPPVLDAIDPAERPLSDEVVEYPLVPDAWRQSTLADAGEVSEWRDRVGAAAGEDGELGTRGPGGGEVVELDPVDAETASARPVGNTIERRGSLREYAREPISARKFATVLDRALRGAPVDPLGPGGTNALVDCYCLVHAVEGVPAGAYQYHPGSDLLERVGDTDRDAAGHLALDQRVVGDAAANVYLLADVEAVVDRLGNRGYRLAQLAGGLALGRLYLATYAHRPLGGRGFTFYDDRVTEHLSPRAAGQTPMTLFALGRPPA